MLKTLRPMNNSRNAYFPVLLYTFLLLAVWAGSWFVAVVRLLLGGEGAVTSLVSSEGVRWALLSVNESIGAAPWGCAVFMLFTAGMLSGSGLFRSFANLFSGSGNSVNEKRSLLFALIALMIFAAIVSLFSFVPWHTLRGVTGGITVSPLSQGWMLLIFIGALVASLVYGFMYGNYRTITDVVSSSGQFMARFMPALISFVPASGILPCLHYTGFLSLLGLEWEQMWVAEAFIYALPFVYVMYVDFAGSRRGK